ncbi:hypothetical protein Xcel_3090 [Xylanimonas cellulosilytica DSM 15894]|uniref:Uncharacterized protein n=1 Tax=Xylanimonas cellulosilytica (strain DSM 15894 / JCM 12276 / CECT 5975 / KCTC 9989 / LMG 20990 / NBRC 107835 / XIL07) TaxID=446471 RepID=D1BZW4_XYLCX|nr:hypothetical protein [Xylanimonas cellulosilytica]ACZ32092.1 hypothetical protein Xcel_3090 [Xylanimonas cellulosilytica DSM 15894]
MSSTPEESPAEPVETTGADPETVDDLRTVVDPASVRRAPRYAAFMVTGVVVGLVAGLALGLFLLATFDPQRDFPMDKPGVWLTVTVMGTTTLTTLLAGLLATVLDRRSLKRWNAHQDADRAV